MTRRKAAGYAVSLRYFRWDFTKQNDVCVGRRPGRPQAASCRIGLNGASMRRFPFVENILLSKISIGNNAEKPHTPPPSAAVYRLSFRTCLHL